MGLCGNLSQKRSVVQQLQEKVHETEMKLEKVKSDHREGNVQKIVICV